MLAPYSTGDSMLLDAKTLVQSESGPYMQAFSELSSVIPKQSGGSRSRRQRRRRQSRQSRRSRKSRQSRQSRQYRQRGGLQEFNGVDGAFATPMGVGMGMGLSGAQAGGRRSQRGGWAAFESAFERPQPGPGQNPQFQTEAQMGYGYNEFKGPQ
jgi:hypothetical protein